MNSAYRSSAGAASLLTMRLPWQPRAVLTLIWIKKWKRRMHEPLQAHLAGEALALRWAV